MVQAIAGRAWLPPHLLWGAWGARRENQLGLLHGNKGKPHGKQPCRGWAALQSSFFVGAGWIALG